MATIVVLILNLGDQFKMAWTDVALITTTATARAILGGGHFLDAVTRLLMHVMSTYALARGHLTAPQFPGIAEPIAGFIAGR